MRLLCVLHGGPVHPSSRFRVLQHLEAFESHGIDAEIWSAKRRSLAEVARFARRARGADVVLIQKKLFNRIQMPVLLGRAPVIFDMDDAYFAVSPDERERFGPERAERRARSRAIRLRAILRRSRRVIAGNRFLAEHAARTAGDVAILPTAIDLRPFPAGAVRAARERRAAGGDGPRLGWIGSRPSLRYLTEIAGPLREVCARHPGARLVQICNDFVDLPGVPTEKIRWSADREAEELMGLDLGLMPLDDSPFSRGKCGLKILQYQAAGLPVVCSPVGANREIVIDGETGIFANGPSDWVAGMKGILADPARARALGERGRRRIEDHYEASKTGARLADLIRTAI